MPTSIGRGELYQAVFNQTLGKCQELVASKSRRKKFRFKNKLMSLDGSVIDLSVSMYDWTKYQRTKEAIKPHLLVDHAGYLPSFAVVAEVEVLVIAHSDAVSIQVTGDSQQRLALGSG